MITAFREREHIFKVRDAGVTEYAVKPVSPKSLFSRIDAVIERPRQFIRVGEFFSPDRRRQKKGYSGDERRGQDKPDEKTLAQTLQESRVKWGRTRSIRHLIPTTNLKRHRRDQKTLPQIKRRFLYIDQ